MIWSCHFTGTGSRNHSLMLKKENRKLYICPYFRGGLGNLMFQYASVYGISRTNNIEIGLYPDDELYNIFELIPPTLSDRKVYSKARQYIGSIRDCAYDVSNVRIPQDSNIVHLSFLQSWKYFDDVRNDIRQHFTFKKEIRKQAHDLINTTLLRTQFSINSKATLVGIHIRRGDYLNKDKRKFGYRVADKEYFKRTMSFFRSKYGNVLFLVFTNPVDDDMMWCKSNLKGNDVVYMFGNSRGVDLCILTLCDHVITSVGTFGWWAAFLNNGTKTYFRNFVTPGSDYEQCFMDNGFDYLYPGWYGF
ncbi:galactoside 2-alpha-L-fucosyltransferase SEC1-like [Ylistrum balloti]|uniref:galactoside 2-alpha-L-fucosyltransferase SEC1-like n=1 Tax=Ylistrum balloti TaxID=509963 RepID=UPI002905F1A4|nr:galactoside 2-alpha-L-fucosyltransferase SEC1-like [Ylistrum balloti]